MAIFVSGNRGGQAYTGVEATTPPQYVVHQRSPTGNDALNFRLGTFWLNNGNPAAISLWHLISLATGVATWVELYPGAPGGAGMFPCNIGVANEAAGVLNILGDATYISTTGAGNTVTINALGAIASQFVQDDGGTATATANIINVHGTAILATSTTHPNTINIGFTAGTNGQIPINATAGAPIWANILSASGTIIITNGHNSIDLATNPASVINTLTGNTGGAVSPTAGNINVVGDTTTTTVTGNPGTHTLTISLVNSSVVTVQTLNAVPTVLFTLALNAGQAIDVDAFVIAAKADYSAAIGGHVNGAARRAGGGAILVGAPVLDYSEDSATGVPVIDFVVSGNNVEILVTGEAGTTYNWKAEVHYQTV